jgi:hypothetical protein
MAAGDALGSLGVISLDTAEVLFNKIFTAPGASALAKPERVPIATLSLLRTYIGDYGLRPAAPFVCAWPLGRGQFLPMIAL